MCGLLRNALRSLLLLAIALVVFALCFQMIGLSKPSVDGRILSPREMASIFGDAGGNQNFCLHSGTCADNFPGQWNKANGCIDCLKTDGTGTDTYKYCCTTVIKIGVPCTQTSTAACTDPQYSVWGTGIYNPPNNNCSNCSPTGVVTQSNPVIACGLKQYTGQGCPQ